MHTRTLALPLVLACAAQAGVPHAAPPARTVTLQLRNTPLRAAVGRLFEGSALVHAVDPAVPDVPLTLNVVAEPFPAALRGLMREASARLPGLTCTGDGFYYVTFRPGFSAPRGVAGTGASSAPEEVEAPTEEVAAENDELHWEKIPLNFADVAQVVVLCGGTVTPALADGPTATGAARGTPGSPALPRMPGAAAGRLSDSAVAGIIPWNWPDRQPDVFNSIVSPNLLIVGLRTDNTIIVRGSDADIEELKTILRLVDVPLRQIRVEFHTPAQSAGGRASNGLPLRLTDTGEGGRMDLVVVPRVNGDTTIELAITGSVASGGSTYPLRTTVRVTQGQAVDLAGLGEGGQMRVWVRAVELPDPAPPAGDR